MAVVTWHEGADAKQAGPTCLPLPDLFPAHPLCLSSRGPAVT